jgi:hypothetical protein
MTNILDQTYALVKKKSLLELHDIRLALVQVKRVSSHQMTSKNSVVYKLQKELLMTNHGRESF